MLDEQDKAKDQLLGKTIASVRTHYEFIELTFTDGSVCEFMGDFGAVPTVIWESEK